MRYISPLPALMVYCHASASMGSTVDVDQKTDMPTAKKRLGKVEEVSPAVHELLKTVYLCQAPSSFENK